MVVELVQQKLMLEAEYMAWEFKVKARDDEERQLRKEIDLWMRVMESKREDKGVKGNAVAVAIDD